MCVRVLQCDDVSMVYACLYVCVCLCSECMQLLHVLVAIYAAMWLYCDCN